LTTARGGADPVPAAPPQRLGRSTAIFAAWTAVSRVAGLAREIVAAALFGTQGAINAFVIAFQVPNLLRSLVADSALSAAFVPVFTELEEQGRKAEARRLVGALAGVITIGLGILSGLAMLLAPWIMPVFAPGLPEGLQEDLVGLARVMFPIVPLLGLTGLVVGVLQAGGTFGPTAFVPVLWNAVILIALLGSALFLEGTALVYAYAVGILLGTLAQLVFLLPYLRGRGPFPFSLGFGNPHVKRVLILMLPVTIGLGLINVNASVDAVFATLVSEESVRAIDAAFRLYILPQGVFSVAISTVIFPAISRLAARDDLFGLRETVGMGLRQIFFMLLPATAFLMVLAEPVVRLVYQRGEFGPASTALTAEALFFYTLGLVFNGASLLLIRAFFSLQRPWLPTAVAAAGMVLNLVFNALLYQPLGTGGIPLSTSITSLITYLLLLRMLERELQAREPDLPPGIGGYSGALDGFVRAALAAALSGLLAWSTWRVLDDALGTSTPAQMVSLGMAFVAATVAYLAAAQAAELPELGQITALARRRRPLQ
jgi:putative peptidoglycan lipid II flippase